MRLYYRNNYSFCELNVKRESLNCVLNMGHFRKINASLKLPQDILAEKNRIIIIQYKTKSYVSSGSSTGREKGSQPDEGLATKEFACRTKRRGNGVYRRCQAAAVCCALKAQLCTPSTNKKRSSPPPLPSRVKEDERNQRISNTADAPVLNPPTEFEAFCQRHSVRVLQISPHGNA
jgi:hypothetical protein